MSRNAWEMEHLSLYRGSVRRTWTEGSYAQALQGHVIEGHGNKTLPFIGAP
jgi:hypothetical protein